MLSWDCVTLRVAELDKPSEVIDVQQAVAARRPNSVVASRTFCAFLAL